MKPLMILVMTFLGVLLFQKMKSTEIDLARAGRISLSAMFLFTAIGHFVFIEGMAKMIPEFIPYRNELVVFSGIFELFLAIALLHPKYFSIVGWVILVFLVMVLPLNVYSAIHRVHYLDPNLDGPGIEYLWFRVPLQFFFMACVYFSMLYPIKKNSPQRKFL